MPPDTNLDEGTQDADSQDDGDQEIDYATADLTAIDDLASPSAQILRDAGERERARALLAETVEEKAGYQEKFKALEARATEVEEWGISDANDPLLRESGLAGVAIADEQARRDALAAAQRAESDRLARLTAEELAAEQAAAAAAKAAEEARAKQVADFEELIASADLQKVVHPLTGKIVAVSKDGRTPEALQPIVDLVHEWDDLPVHKRDAWWNQRTTLEVDALSVLVGIHPPVSFDDIEEAR